MTLVAEKVLSPENNWETTVEFDLIPSLHEAYYFQELNDHQQSADPKTESQKLEKEQLKEATGGSYEPDTEPKSDDILLPELEI